MSCGDKNRLCKRALMLRTLACVGNQKNIFSKQRLTGSLFLYKIITHERASLFNVYFTCNIHGVAQNGVFGLFQFTSLLRQEATLAYDVEFYCHFS